MTVIQIRELRSQSFEIQKLKTAFSTKKKSNILIFEGSWLKTAGDRFFLRTINDSKVVCNRGHTLECQDGLQTRKLCHSKVVFRTLSIQELIL